MWRSPTGPGFWMRVSVNLEAVRSDLLICSLGNRTLGVPEETTPPRDETILPTGRRAAETNAS